MLLLSVDITNHLKSIFDFIYSIYEFLNSLEFSAFGFDFSLLGIFLALIILILLVKFMKFGIEEGASSSIKYHRSENKHDKKIEENGGSKWI